jgi:hypothetical protein
LNVIVSMSDKHLGHRIRASVCRARETLALLTALLTSPICFRQP